MLKVYDPKDRWSTARRVLAPEVSFVKRLPNKYPPSPIQTPTPSHPLPPPSSPPICHGRVIGPLVPASSLCHQSQTGHTARDAGTSGGRGVYIYIYRSGWRWPEQAIHIESRVYQTWEIALWVPPSCLMSTQCKPSKSLA